MTDQSNLFMDLAMPGVRGLRPYQPGKPMAELEREYGVSDIIKLASNENPLGPSPKALLAAQVRLAAVNRYPDGNGYSLKEALAGRHNVDSVCITLGSGSNEVLDLVARVFLGPGLEAVCSAHAFAIYALVTQAVGARAAVAPANSPDHDMPYGHDLQAMLTLINERTRVVFVANPNNPTGTWLGESALEAFLEKVPERVVVVLDEAYFEYARDVDCPDATRWMARFPNLIVTRTFSKAYGLAGFRIGYGLSHPDVADLLNRVRAPFNTSEVAQAAAVAALQDENHINETVALNRTEIRRLCKGFARLRLSYLPSAGNFVAVSVGPRVEEVNEALLRRGIIVRPIAAYGLPGFLRVTVGLPRENDRLLDAFGDLSMDGLTDRG